MAPKTKDTSNVTFSFNTVAVLVAAMKAKNITLGMKEYQKMAALDGTKSASSFDHQFREVKQRANEMVAAGDEDAPKKTPKTPTIPNSGGKSAGSKRKSNKIMDSESEGSDDVSDTPAKKIKKEPKGDHDEDDACWGVFQ